MRAAKYGRTDVVRLILDSGADANMRDKVETICHC